jgi:hypothetical protein
VQLITDMKWQRRGMSCADVQMLEPSVDLGGYLSPSTRPSLC